MSDTPPVNAGDSLSHGLGSLALAMSKAQAEIKVAVFDKKANYGMYASFKSVREASIEALSKYQLSIFQPVHFDGTNYCLETLVIHSSGESISSKIKLLIDKQNMQGLGSAITYAKRYAWAAILGVVSDDDDDGQAASTGEVRPPAQKQKQAPPPAQARPPQGPTVPMLKRLYAIGSGMSWTSDAIRVYSIAKVKKTPGELSKLQYDQLCKFIGDSPYDENQAAEIDAMYANFSEDEIKKFEGEKPLGGEA